MSKILAAIEWVLTWIERLRQLPWGRTMIAIVAAVIVAGWGWFTSRPLLDIVVLSLAAFAAVLAILCYAPILLERVRPFPFCVSVRAIATSNQSFQAYVLILNRRPG